MAGVAHRKALGQLEEFLELPEMNKYEEQGLVKAFEYTYESGWKTLQDFLFEEAVQRLIKLPKTGHPYLHQTKRIFLNRFPYEIVYKV